MAVALRNGRTNMTISEMALATPDTRDRFVDMLRALSIAVVVFGHWLAAIVYWDGGAFEGRSALDEIPWTWTLTWFLQVMPLFFFVGGFSNAVSLRALRKRAGTYTEFLRSRIDRLTRPTLVFVGAWIVIAAIADVVLGSEEVRAATPHIAKPLWFLAVYVLVIALSPAMLRLHDRYRWKVPLTMALGAVAIDVVRLTFSIEHIGYLNFAFVWLFPHQLGFFYADGTLTRWTRRATGALALAGFSALAVLTSIGVYSRSMVGTETTAEGVSNNDPPSICLIALTLGLVGIAMSFREPANRWLARPRPWGAVIAANSMIMTVFLWHLTALVVVVLVLYPLGFPQPEAGTGTWWATRPLWLGSATAALALFVIPLLRFERPRLRLEDDRPRDLPRAHLVAGITLLIVGLGGLAQGGVAGLLSPEGTPLVFFTSNPLTSAFHTFAGAAILLGRGRRIVPLALVLLGIAELGPTADVLGNVLPIAAPNAVLHLGTGVALSLSAHGERRTR